jgi:hypothetical protein
LLYVLPLTQFDAFAFAAAISAWKLQNLRHSSRLIIAVGPDNDFPRRGQLHQHFVARSAFKASPEYQMYMLAGGGFGATHYQLQLVICAIQKLAAVGFLRNGILSRTGVISYGIYIYQALVLIGLKWLLDSTTPASLTVVRKIPNTA